MAEDATAATPPVRLDVVPIERAAELIVYRDPAAARAWDEKGAVPELVGTMVHLTLSDATITVTVDDVPPSEIRSIVDEISRGLTNGVSAGNGVTRSPGAVNPTH